MDGDKKERERKRTKGREKTIKGERGREKK